MLPQLNRNAHAAKIQEDVSREDIVSAFRSAMVGHFRSQVPGTNINESTLLASDYLSHFHELVMLFEGLTIAAYRGAPAEVRARFDEAVARLHGEALSLVACVGAQLDAGQTLEGACQVAVGRLRILIADANAIATGEAPAEAAAPGAQGYDDSQAAPFANNLARFDP